MQNLTRRSTSRPSRFAKGSNPGTKTCIDCGRRTWTSNIDRSTGLCIGVPAGGSGIGCYDKAGYENEHCDGRHAVADLGPQQWCPTCQSVMAKLLPIIEASPLPVPTLQCPVCGSISSDSVPNLIAHLAQKHLGQ